MAELKLSIYSPVKKLIENESVTELTLTGAEGELQILPDHVNFVSTIEQGPFSYQSTSGQKVKGELSGGFFQVEEQNVYVMAERIETSQ